MVHTKRHHFLAQFSIPFHMVWSVLLQVLAQKTTLWLVKKFWQPIRNFYSMVFEANTRNKTDHTMWKGIENCARKWCLFLNTIWFEVTCAFWNMCLVINLTSCSILKPLRIQTSLVLSYILQITWLYTFLIFLEHCRNSCFIKQWLCEQEHHCLATEWWNR